MVLRHWNRYFFSLSCLYSAFNHGIHSLSIMLSKQQKAVQDLSKLYWNGELGDVCKTFLHNVCVSKIVIQIARLKILKSRQRVLLQTVVTLRNSLGLTIKKTTQILRGSLQDKQMVFKDLKLSF
jgi:hypothetical protein